MPKRDVFSLQGIGYALKSNITLFTPFMTLIVKELHPLCYGLMYLCSAKTESVKSMTMNVRSPLLISIAITALLHTMHVHCTSTWEPQGKSEKVSLNTMMDLFY